MCFCVCWLDSRRLGTNKRFMMAYVELTDSTHEATRASLLVLQHNLNICFCANSDRHSKTNSSLFYLALSLSLSLAAFNSWADLDRNIYANTYRQKTHTPKHILYAHTCPSNELIQKPDRRQLCCGHLGIVVLKNRMLHAISVYSGTFIISQQSDRHR